MRYDKTSGQGHQHTPQTSNVYSLEERREMKRTHSGGVVEYPCVDIISYELVDFDGKMYTVRFDDE